MKKLAEFDKEGFKKEIATNVKTLYRKTLEEATPQEIYQAVSYSVKDDIIELYDSSTDRLIETISGNELGELVHKLNMASGIFVNKKV